MLMRRFEGVKGQERLLDELLKQRLVQGDAKMAAAILAAGEVVFPDANDVIIEQRTAGDDVFFILGGDVGFAINGRPINRRNAGRTVGEMSAINPTLPRSATVTAGEHCVLIRIGSEALAEIADQYAAIWKRLAIDLSERLEERNLLIRPCNLRPKVFIISAAEARDVADAIQFKFAHDEADFRIWTDEVFRASHYPLDELEAVLDESDLAIAIASPEDIVEMREKVAMQPRDNVLVELGIAIGKLGRKRSLLLVPAKSDIRLPSDFKGLTPISYKIGDSTEISQHLGPACHQIRQVLREQGVRQH